MYHLVSTSIAFFWPSTTKYWPVPPYTDPVPSYINQYRSILSQYHQVSINTDLYWPSTIIYQPVPASTDPVPPSTNTNQYHSILTRYHQVSTNTNLYSCCLGITDSCTVSPGSCCPFNYHILEQAIIPRNDISHVNGSYRLSSLLISCIDIQILGSLSVRWVVGVAGPTLYSVVCTFVSQEAFWIGCPKLTHWHCLNCAPSF